MSCDAVCTTSDAALGRASVAGATDVTCRRGLRPWIVRWNTMVLRLSVWISIAVGALLSGVVEGNVTVVTSVVQGNADLPCNVTHLPEENKAVALILWYKDNSSTPIYTIDARTGDFSMAKHFPTEDLVGRAVFDSSAQPTLLKFTGVVIEDAGQYRCRVDYRQARTENQLTSLKVIVPPQEIIVFDEYGQKLVDEMGPYNEGSTIFLICEAEGGDPSPEVTWWKNSEIIDDTYTVRPQGFVRNELRLGPLRRSDLMAKIVCQATNTNLTEPVSSGVNLEINLRPTKVKITSPSGPVSAGERVELRCEALGARPFSQISWFKDGLRLVQSHEFVSRATNSTSSTAHLSVGVKDHGRRVVCQAHNPVLPKSELSDVLPLNVHYAPVLNLSSERTTPLEGQNLTLRCFVDANPPVLVVSWRHNGRILDTKNASLRLVSVSRNQSGAYECLASNEEGEGFSNQLQLAVFHAPVCRESQTNEYAASQDHLVRVVCAVHAHPAEVHFEWIANTTLRRGRINTYLSNGTRSIATTLTGSDGGMEYGQLLCFATNVVGKQLEPCVFRLVPPAPPGSPENCSAINLSPNSVLVQCVAGSTGGLPPQFFVEVFGVNADILHLNVSSAKAPHFRLTNLPQDTSFLAAVYASNARGRSLPTTVQFATISLSRFSSASDEVSAQILNPVFSFLIALVLLLACALMLLSLTKHRRHGPPLKGSKESSEPEKYSPRKNLDEYTPDASYHSPDLISTKHGTPGKPDIANTAQQLQGSGTDVAAIPGDQRDDRLTAKPCIILEKPRYQLSSSASCENVELKPAPPLYKNVVDSRSRGYFLESKLVREGQVTTCETPLISHLQKGIELKTIGQRRARNSTPV